MPHPFSRTCIECHHRLGEQIVALAITAVPIVGRRADREEQQSAFGVEAHRGPHVGVAHVFVRFILPRAPAKFARIGNGLEGPHAPARAHVERLHIAWRAVGVAQTVAYTVANNDDVAVYDGW